VGGEKLARALHQAGEKLGARPTGELALDGLVEDVVGGVQTASSGSGPR